MRLAHDKKIIRSGDRHDVLLRRLMIDVTGHDVNWREKDPALYPHRWLSSMELVEAMRRGDVVPMGSLALSTDISVCRVHFARRWPGWNIENDLRSACTRHGAKHSFCRIARAPARPRTHASTAAAEADPPFATGREKAHGTPTASEPPCLSAAREQRSAAVRRRRGHAGSSPSHQAAAPPRRVQAALFDSGPPLATWPESTRF